ncbi:hypothetical protein Tco_1522534 [Tanacetum coccineum]
MAGEIGAQWLRSPAGYLSMSLRLRLPCFLLADEIPNWGVVARPLVSIVPLPLLYQCFFSLEFTLGQFCITERLFRPQIIIHPLQHLINRLSSGTLGMALDDIRDLYWVFGVGFGHPKSI